MVAASDGRIRFQEGVEQLPARRIRLHDRIGLEHRLQKAGHCTDARHELQIVVDVDPEFTRGRQPVVKHRHEIVAPVSREARQQHQAETSGRGVHLRNHAVGMETDSRILDDIVKPTHGIQLNEVIDVGDEAVPRQVRRAFRHSLAVEIAARAVEPELKTTELFGDHAKAGGHEEAEEEISFTAIDRDGLRRGQQLDGEVRVLLPQAGEARCEIKRSNAFHGGKPHATRHSAAALQVLAHRDDGAFDPFGVAKQAFSSLIHTKP